MSALSPDLLALLARASLEPAAPEPIRVLSTADWARLAGMDGYRLAAIWADRERAIGVLEVDGHAAPIATDNPEAAIAVMHQAHPDLAPVTPSEAFAALPGDGVYQIGEGPVGGMLAMAAHRRLHVAGNRLVQVEHRFGYVHRGLSALITGKSPRAAARFAARISGGATVAHSLAFARAAEAACGVVVPESAARLREAMAETEQCVAALLALAGLADYCVLPALATRLIERRDAIAAAAETIFFNRLMMDMVVPGGLDTVPRLAEIPALITALRAVRPAVLRFGDWRWRRRWADAAALVRARVWQAIDAAEAASANFEGFDASLGTEPWLTGLPAASGSGLGQAAGVDRSIYCFLRLEGGFIEFCGIANGGLASVAALERAAPGLTAESFARRAALLMPPIGMIDL